MKQSDVRLAAVFRRITKSAQPVDDNWYEWKFQYGYRVDGIEYTSDRLGFVVTPYWNDDSALEIAARYPAGAAVLAYVSPDDPAFAVLQPGPSFPTLLLLGSAILAAIGAAWMLPGVSPRKSRLR